jgi:hypothetical protein
MITKHEGKSYKNGAFDIDECFFLNCVLTECDLFYSGGDVEMLGTRIENCRFHPRGPALKTIQMLQSMGMLKVGPLPVPMKVEMGKVN